MSENYLFLDPSLRFFAWAVINKRKKIMACGCIHTKGDGSPEEDTGNLQEIANTLLCVMQDYAVTKVISEDFVGSKSQRASVALAAVKGVVISCCCALSLNLQYVRAKTVKKELTGDDCAKKDQMVAEAETAYPEFKKLMAKKDKESIKGVADAISVALYSFKRKLV